MINIIFSIALGISILTDGAILFDEYSEDSIYYGIKNENNRTRTNNNMNSAQSPTVDPCAETGLDRDLIALCYSQEVCQGFTLLSNALALEGETAEAIMSSPPPQILGITSTEETHYCPSESDSPRIEQAVLEEWQTLQLPAPEITTFPLDGQTLVNMDNWFQAPQDPILHATTLLNQPVLIRATPAVWSWDYGDGGQPKTLKNAGPQYPDPKDTYQYRGSGTYRLAVTITWSAQYSVNDGSTWQEIPTPAITTSSTEITVREHRPRLIS